MNKNQILNKENHNAFHSVTDIWAFILTFSYINMTNCKAVPDIWTVMYKKQVLWKSTIQFHMQVLARQSQHFSQSHPKYYVLHSKMQT